MGKLYFSDWPVERLTAEYRRINDKLPSMSADERVSARIVMSLIHDAVNEKTGGGKKPAAKKPAAKKPAAKKPAAKKPAAKKPAAKKPAAKKPAAKKPAAKKPAAKKPAAKKLKKN